jgi:hypothetical protein
MPTLVKYYALAIRDSNFTNGRYEVFEREFPSNKPLEVLTGIVDRIGASREIYLDGEGVVLEGARAQTAEDIRVLTQEIFPNGRPQDVNIRIVNISAVALYLQTVVQQVDPMLVAPRDYHENQYNYENSTNIPEEFRETQYCVYDLIKYFYKTYPSCKVRIPLLNEIIEYYYSYAQSTSEGAVLLTGNDAPMYSNEQQCEELLKNQQKLIVLQDDVSQSIPNITISDLIQIAHRFGFGLYIVDPLGKILAQVKRKSQHYPTVFMMTNGGHVFLLNEKIQKRVCKTNLFRRVKDQTEPRQLIPVENLHEKLLDHLKTNKTIPKYVYFDRVEKDTDSDIRLYRQCVRFNNMIEKNSDSFQAIEICEKLELPHNANVKIQHILSIFLDKHYKYRSTLPYALRSSFENISGHMFKHSNIVFDDFLNKSSVFSQDFKRQYSRILFQTYYPVFTGNEEPIMTNLIDPNDPPFTLYYVQTESIFPFQGSGFYIKPFLEGLLSEGIVLQGRDQKPQKYTITHKIISDHWFKLEEKHVELLKQISENNKILINAGIGFLSFIERHVKTFCIEQNRMAAAVRFFSMAQNGQISSCKEETDIPGLKDLGLHAYSFEKRIPMIQTGRLIYYFTVQLGNRYLYDLYEHINNQGGQICAVYIDSITYVDIHYNGRKDKVGHQTVKLYPNCKFENLTRGKVFALNGSTHISDLVYNGNPITLPSDVPSMPSATSSVATSPIKNILYLGPPGTGKTRKALLSLPKNVIKLAPTNRIANRIGGKTVHNYLSKKAGESLFCQHYPQIPPGTIIMIEELFLCNPSIVSFLQYLTLNNIQVIATGDDRQLRINDPNISPLGASILSMFQVVRLYENHRCDLPTQKLFEDVYDDPDKFQVLPEWNLLKWNCHNGNYPRTCFITYYNKRRHQIHDAVYKNSQIVSIRNNLTLEKQYMGKCLYLDIGHYVMFCNKYEADGYVILKNTSFVITKIEGANIHLYPDDRFERNTENVPNNLIITVDEAAKNLTNSLAITCHKVQGETIRDTNIVIDRQCRTEDTDSYLYTAVSRAKFYDQLYRL